MAVLNKKIKIGKKVQLFKFTKYVRSVAMLESAIFLTGAPRKIIKFFFFFIIF